MQARFEEYIGASSPPRPWRSSKLPVPAVWQLLHSHHDEPINRVWEALSVLDEKRYSLYLGDAQVKALLSVVRICGKETQERETAGHIAACAAAVLSVWVRGNGRRVSTKLLQDITLAFSGFLEDADVSVVCSCEVVLLLGCICAATACSSETKRQCQNLLVKELTIRREALVQSSSFSEALAGVGYAIIGSKEPILRSIVAAIFQLWTPNSAATGTLEPPLHHAKMIMRLFELLEVWLSILNAAQLQEVMSIWDEILREASFPAEKIAKVMAAAGLLRGTQKHNSVEGYWGDTKAQLEAMIKDEAAHIKQELGDSEDAWQNILELSPPITTLHRLRCLSLALTRCKDFRPDAASLFCVTFSLLGDAIDLRPFYAALIRASEGPPEDLKPSVMAAQKQLTNKVEGLMFVEAGVLARALCDQYRQISDVLQQQVEAIFWNFSVSLYERCRLLRILLSAGAGEMQSKQFAKIMETTFLSMVLFYSTSLAESSIPQSRKAALAPYALDAFSCIEYFRRFSLPEYADILKCCVAVVAVDCTAASKLASLLPISEEVVQCSALSLQHYSWREDEVQAYRLSFYFRILSSCASKIDSSVFENRVAPLMFLYMQHPSKQVTEISHVLFSSFVSGQDEPGQDAIKSNERPSLAEQLAVYYTNHAVKGYPQLTSYEGLVHGVRAIAAHLPPGSVATIHCLEALVQRAITLARNDDEAFHKLQTLLLHLILLVDLQVLSHLLKELASLVVNLTSSAQKQRAVSEAAVLVQDSNDCVRKPVVVPWLQSLAFLASDKRHSRI